MKKLKVLKNLPNYKKIVKRAAELNKQLPKLEVELDNLEELITALEDVELYENFPVVVKTTSDNVINVTSGCDESKRHATVAPIGKTNKFVVVGYHNMPVTDNQSTHIQGEHTKTQALKIAKNFVATGKISLPKTDEAKTKTKRGRPAKN